MAVVTAERARDVSGASQPTASLRPLRIALIADSRVQPRWMARAFGALAEGLARIEVLAELGESPPGPSLLWRAYRRIDHRAFGKGEDLEAPCDLAAELSPRRVISLRGGPREWRATLAELEPDVVFALGTRSAGVDADLAPLGVWRFGFGEEHTPDPTAALLASSGESVLASSLLARLRGTDGERILCRAWSRTFPMSVSRTWRGLLPKTAEFAARALVQAQRSGAQWIAGRQRAYGVRQEPTGGGLAHLGRLGPRLAGRALQRAAFVDQWLLAFRFGLPPGWDGDLAGFQLLVPPKDRFWADPFAIERDGRHYLFFEELPFATGKAHISLIVIDRDGRASAPVPVLERDYHLSYPFLVEHGGELYMVPETGQNGSVEVYRCVDFPHRWELHRVLLEGLCTADASFHRTADGKWWMFVGVYARGAEFAEGADELHLYHADDFQGPWRPHPGNPVKSDVRSARPAGRLYEEGGALYRPAQIGVPLYGSGVSINRIVKLTEREFVEREVGQIRPGRPPGMLGLHTFNRAAGLTVVDAFTRTARWR